MPWLSFVQTVFIIPLCSIPPCKNCKLQVGFGAGSPRKFSDFNSLKSHFLRLQVIIKDRILVRFQLGKCFLLLKIYLSWKIWPISVENQCGFPSEMMSEKWVQKLLYILSMTTVFIWNCFHHRSPPNHPFCTLLPSLWSRLRERPSLIFATPPLVSLRDDVWEMSSKIFILLTCHYRSR